MPWMGSSIVVNGGKLHMVTTIKMNAPTPCAGPRPSQATWWWIYQTTLMDPPSTAAFLFHTEEEWAPEACAAGWIRERGRQLAGHRAQPKATGECWLPQATGAIGWKRIIWLHNFPRWVVDPGLKRIRRASDTLLDLCGSRLQHRVLHGGYAEDVRCEHQCAVRGLSPAERPNPSGLGSA